LDRHSPIRRTNHTARSKIRPGRKSKKQKAKSKKQKAKSKKQKAKSKKQKAKSKKQKAGPSASPACCGQAQDDNLAYGAAASCGP